MKAVRGAEGGVVVVDVHEPPGMGELLTMKSTSICSSDLTYLRYGARNIMGHELAGVREDGTPVIVEAMYSCGTCELCRDGLYNLCGTMSTRALGAVIDGGMVEQFRAPSAHLVDVPSGVDVRDASIVEPATVAWHALNLAGTNATSRVAVVGAGALGLLAVAGARRMGAAEVSIEARHRHQKQSAERLGAHVGASGKYDVVVEAAGSPEGLAHAIDLVGPRGTVVVVSVHLGNVNIDWRPLFHHEARLIPSLGYCRHEQGREMDAAAAMIAADPEIARTLITHRFPLADAQEAFRVAADRSAGAIRVVIEP